MPIRWRDSRGRLHISNGLRRRRQTPRPVSTFIPRLWGKNLELPFEVALARQEIKHQEVRAVELLRSLCDQERFAIYLQWGDIPARGNLTGHMYLVRRFARVAEFINGKQVAEWCISIDKNKFPETDNIVAMKNMIEGEESIFRGTANLFADPKWWEKNLPAIPHILDL